MSTFKDRRSGRESTFTILRDFKTEPEDCEPVSDEERRRLWERFVSLRAAQQHQVDSE